LPSAKSSLPGSYDRFCRLQREQGLTLIELLVTLAITGFIITTLYTFYLAGLQSWNRAIDHLEYQQSARIALDTIITELRHAHRVEIVPGQQQMLYYHSYHKGKETLFRFRLAGEQLLFEQRTATGGHHSTNVVALGIREVSYATDSDYRVHVVITAGDDRKAVTLGGSIRPRNLAPAAD
jgi:prepilin-type N-terminal cleavage/methylation domain-containing protein